MTDTITTTSPALDVRELGLKYGGVAALAGVDVTVPQGRIVGLIGPNGSGKSSFINVVSGAYRGPYSGTVRIDGADVRAVRADRRASAGLARIFQGIRLFDTLTVEQNIMIGAHSHYRSGYVGSILRTRRAREEHRRQRERAAEIMAIFGERLLPRRDQQVLSLSYANRRRVEISRALMTAPRLLLLDEPMAGMNPHETEELTDQLLTLNRERSLSMLLVEHKMGVIGELCDDVYVLDSGRVIAHGTADAVQSDPKVVEAFLG
jgi:ABC-type branched-subunit amino acid transport system ATPase component